MYRLINSLLQLEKKRTFYYYIFDMSVSPEFAEKKIISLYFARDKNCIHYITCNMCYEQQYEGPDHVQMTNNVYFLRLKVNCNDFQLLIQKPFYRFSKCLKKIFH